MPRRFARHTLASFKCVIALLLASAAFTACQSDQDAPAEMHDQEITLSFQTPTPGWSIETQHAYWVDNEIWCLYRIQPPAGVAMQMISELTHTFTVKSPSPDAPVQHFVLGKTWNWNSNPEINFIESADSLQQALAEATPLALISE